MNHPFIVKLRYAFQTNKELYLIMEYCSGGDVAKLLRENNRLIMIIITIIMNILIIFN
jgi:serine/threonine protein kinase